MQVKKVASRESVVLTVKLDLTMKVVSARSGMESACNARVARRAP